MRTYVSTLFLLFETRDGAVVSSSLQEMLVDAQQQGRLTCGIYDSGTLLAKYVHDLYFHIDLMHKFTAVIVESCDLHFHTHVVSLQYMLVEILQHNNLMCACYSQLLCDRQYSCLAFHM